MKIKLPSHEETIARVEKEAKQLECISSFLRTVFAVYAQLIEPRDILYVSYWIRTYQIRFCVQESGMLLQIYPHQETGGSVQKQETSVATVQPLLYVFFVSSRWIVLNYGYNNFFKWLNFFKNVVC